RGNGFYLNTNCHLDYVKHRALDIMSFGRFKSLFLDVEATAMAREDYSGNIDTIRNRSTNGNSNSSPNGNNNS
ncbi:glycoside hydrolase, partial [Vibrio echinoideorum]